MIPMDVGRCQVFIDTNINQLYDLLRKGVTVQNICQSLGLCTFREAPVVPKPLPRVTSDNCQLCQMISGYVIDELKVRHVLSGQAILRFLTFETGIEISVRERERERESAESKLDFV